MHNYFIKITWEFIVQKKRPILRNLILKSVASVCLGASLLSCGGGSSSSGSTSSPSTFTVSVGGF
jgi:hypothetical protein